MKVTPCASICASQTEWNQFLTVLWLYICVSMAVSRAAATRKMVNYTEIFGSITANAFVLYAGAILTLSFCLT